jgi:hypothetical protein
MGDKGSADVIPEVRDTLSCPVARPFTQIHVCLFHELVPLPCLEDEMDDGRHPGGT